MIRSVILLIVLQTVLGRKADIDHPDFVDFPPPPFLEYYESIDPGWVIRNTSVLNDTKCNQEFISVIKGINNKDFWIKPYLDSTGKINAGLLTGHKLFLGSLDGCLQYKLDAKGFIGQYCLLTFEVINSTQPPKIGLMSDRSNKYFLGQCVPSSCSISYMNSIFSELKIPTTDVMINEYVNITIQDGDCHQRNEKFPLTQTNWITLSLFFILAGIALVSTMYDLWQRDIRNNDNPSKILIAFSLITNTRYMLSSKHPKGKFASVNGIKSFTLFYIIYLNIFQYNVDGNVMDSTYAWALAYNNGLVAVFVNNAFWAIDSFLFLSGAMMVISFYKNNQRNGFYNPIFSIIKQYIRLMTPLMALVVIRMGISDQLGYGPVYNSFNKIFKKPCADSLRPTILLYQNYISAYTETCLKNSWYILVNLQLFIFSQLILIIAVRSSRVASKIPAMLTIIAAVMEFWLMYLNNVGITPAMDGGPLLAQYYYGYAHTRATPWFAGMTFGFIMHECMKTDWKISQKYKFLGWIVIGAAFSASVFSISFFDFENYSQPSAAIYVCMHRIVWSLAVGWLVFSSYYGFSGLMGRVLAWGPFQLIGKLSLEAYLWSLPITEYIISMARDTIYLSSGRVAFHFFPNCAYSLLLAMLTHLLIIIPLKMLLTYCTQTIRLLSIKTKNETKEEKNGF